MPTAIRRCGEHNTGEDEELFNRCATPNDTGAITVVVTEDDIVDEMDTLVEQADDAIDGTCYPFALCVEESGNIFSCEEHSCVNTFFAVDEQFPNDVCRYHSDSEKEYIAIGRYVKSLFWHKGRR